MTQSQWTPGPWEVREIYPHCIAIAGTSTEVARAAALTGSKNVRRNVRLANARLIAAAPELYEAADHVVNSLELVLSARVPPKLRATIQAIIDELTPALAKATT